MKNTVWAPWTYKAPRLKAWVHFYVVLMKVEFDSSKTCVASCPQFSLSINTSHFKVWHNRYQLSVISLIFLALVPEVLNMTSPFYEHRSGKKEEERPAKWILESPESWGSLGALWELQFPGPWRSVKASWISHSLRLPWPWLRKEVGTSALCPCRGQEGHSPLKHIPLWWRCLVSLQGSKINFLNNEFTSNSLL